MMSLSIHLVELAMDTDPLVSADALMKLRETPHDFIQIRQSYASHSSPEKFMKVDDLLFQLELERIRQDFRNWIHGSLNLRDGIDLLERCVEPNQIPAETDILYDELLMSVYRQYKDDHTDLDKCLILIDNVRALNILSPHLLASDIHFLWISALHEPVLYAPLALCLVQALAQDLGLPLAMIHMEDAMPMMALFPSDSDMRYDQALVWIDLRSAELQKPETLSIDSLFRDEKMSIPDDSVASARTALSFLAHELLKVIELLILDGKPSLTLQRQYRTVQMVLEVLAC